MTSIAGGQNKTGPQRTGNKKAFIRKAGFLNPKMVEFINERGGSAHNIEIKQDVNKYFIRKEGRGVDDMTIMRTFERLTTDGPIKHDAREYQLVLAGIKHLFTWDNLPGKDNKKLLKFLKQDYRILRVNKARIEKINDFEIRVTAEKKSLSLILNAERTGITLEINDGRRDEFIAKLENSKINIYKFMNYMRPYLPFQILRNTKYLQTLNIWIQDINNQVPEERIYTFAKYSQRAKENIFAFINYVFKKYTDIEDPMEAEEFFDRSLEAIHKLIKRSDKILYPPKGMNKPPKKKRDTLLPVSDFGFVEEISTDKWQDM